jgi:glycosyltransferase involved in cell wall biosynthesis
MTACIVIYNTVIGGPRKVAISITNELIHLYPDVNWVIVADGKDDLEALAEMANTELHIVPNYGKWYLLWWEQVAIPLRLTGLNIDVMLNTKNSVPVLGLYKKIAIIHDIANYLFPQSFGFFQRLHMRMSTNICKLVADKIVSVSHHTRGDLMRLAKIKARKVSVIYNGVDQAFPNLTIPSSERRKSGYMLFVGTLQPRKNVDTLLDAFLQFKTEHHSSLKLKIAGRKGWLYEILLDKIASNAYKKDIEFLGMVSDSELKALYSGAKIFVYPSNYDGFGLVPLEAMSYGIPTIVSDVSSLPEVVGEAAIKVHPRDVSALSRAIHRLDSDTNLYEKLASEGRRQAAKYRWDQAARQYYTLMKDLSSDENTGKE